LVTRKLRTRGLPSAASARSTIGRGAEIFVLGLLFRVQEYLIAWGWAPWTDLFRVDILNTIGVSMMLMGLVCWVVPASNDRRQQSSTPLLTLILAAVAVALCISLLTPPLWTTWCPRWIPWPFQSYINGVHNLGQPQAWLFPVFPWSAFAFAGLAVGFLLQSDWTHQHEAPAFVLAGLSGAALIAIGRRFDHLPYQLYATYDFWHTSPNFFLIRVGLLLIILGASYAWCRWGAGQWGFNPLVQMGQTSLLVYWVHIEFVYGRFSILPKHGQNILGASYGLLVICLMMLALSFLRRRTKGRGAELWGWLRTRTA